MEFLDKNGLQHMLESLKPHMSSSTPDWNSKEGQDGYIKNRTHYEMVYDNGREYLYEGDTSLFVYTNPAVDLYAFTDGFFNSTTAVKVVEGALLPVKSGASILVQKVINSYSGAIGKRIYFTQPIPVDTEAYFGSIECMQLDSRFIPDDIARQNYVESLEARILQLEEKIANL